MNKTKTIFKCSSCNHISSKWTGKCVECGQWNTVIEEIISAEMKNTSINLSVKKPKLLNEVFSEDYKRLKVVDQELNRVLGGGLVSGSVVLIAGEPGIGKSTLTLKIALNFKSSVLYIAGEESSEQIKMRAKRLNIKNNNCYIYSETNVGRIISECNEINPSLIIVDSIQTLHVEHIDSSTGSINQIRHSTEQLIRFSKEKSVPVIIIGHITKDGSIAGPKVLEHMVDTVLQFEGDKSYMYRIVRSIKNRFGRTNEIAIYEMNESGLQEVQSPSKMLISPNQEKLSGIALSCSMEGIRPMMIEIQGLTSPATYGNPQRSSNGIDLKRLNMLLAVIEKRGGMKLSQKDIFLNITGGLKVKDTATDLAIVSAILSSNFDLYIDPKTCFIGEVGLSGEIRPVSRINERINEVVKMGMEKIYISKYSEKKIQKSEKYNLIRVGKIQEIIQQLFKT